MMRERKIDRVRANPTVAHTPDEGRSYYPRTLDIGECSTNYDAYKLEKDLVVFGIAPNLQSESNYCNHHPVLLTHESAQDHFYALLAAALMISDCCHKEPVLLSRVVYQMSARSDSTDYHTGMFAAAVLLGNATVSGFPISAAIAACVMGEDDID